jgi:hypothetical protein
MTAAERKLRRFFCDVLGVIPAKGAGAKHAHPRAGIHNPGRHDAEKQGIWIPALASLGRDDGGACGYATPSFFCKLVDEVVYWNTRRLSG